MSCCAQHILKCSLHTGLDFFKENKHIRNKTCFLILLSDVKMSRIGRLYFFMLLSTAVPHKKVCGLNVCGFCFSLLMELCKLT